jgi:predicted Fe-Mo cluster-binding NifX family protein
MIVAVPAAGGSINAPVAKRFGRCSYFVLVDTETLRFEAFSNPSVASPSGAGVSAARDLAKRDTEVVLTAQIGPKAERALQEAGIRIVTGAEGTVREAVLGLRGEGE